jgi:hypothetical protein
MFTGTDSASQRKLGVAFKACLRYIHIKRRLDNFSHLDATVTGTLFVNNAKIQLLSFLYKVLHARHTSYLFSLFHFASFYACYESVICGFGLLSVEFSVA